MLDRPQDLLREYAQLNRKRKADGVTPLEYQRWLDLSGKLKKTFPGRSPPGGGGKTHMCVEFQSDRDLELCTMMNVRPIGLFVNTSFAADPGTNLILHVCVVETGSVFDSPVSVISNNVGPDFSTAVLGMGLRFASSGCALRSHLEKLCGIERQPEEGGRPK